MNEPNFINVEKPSLMPHVNKTASMSVCENEKNYLDEDISCMFVGVLKSIQVAFVPSFDCPATLPLPPHFPLSSDNVQLYCMK